MLTSLVCSVCCVFWCALNRSSLHFRNRAIVDYLRSNGYEEAYSVFKKEAELDMVRSVSQIKIEPSPNLCLICVWEINVVCWTN